VHAPGLPPSPLASPHSAQQHHPAAAHAAQQLQQQQQLFANLHQQQQQHQQQQLQQRQSTAMPGAAIGGQTDANGRPLTIMTADGMTLILGANGMYVPVQTAGSAAGGASASFPGAPFGMLPMMPPGGMQQQPPQAQGDAPMLGLHATASRGGGLPAPGGGSNGVGVPGLPIQMVLMQQQMAQLAHAAHAAQAAQATGSMGAVAVPPLPIPLMQIQQALAAAAAIQQNAAAHAAEGVYDDDEEEGEFTGRTSRRSSIGDLPSFTSSGYSSGDA